MYTGRKRKSVAQSYVSSGGQCSVLTLVSLEFDYRYLSSSLFRRVTRPHGNSGVVRAKFRNNIPPHAFGASVRVVGNIPFALIPFALFVLHGLTNFDHLQMLYPSNI